MLCHPTPRAGSIAIALSALLAACASSGPDSTPQIPARERPHPKAALAAGRWLEHVAEVSGDELHWRADPESNAPNQYDLYSGSAGVVLFFLELWNATGDDQYLELARRAADGLRAGLPSVLERGELGLYTGAAGIGFALETAYRATGEPRLHDAATECVHAIVRGATPRGSGVQWSATTDVISGTAGIGLFLLWEARARRDTALIDLARLAGSRLLELAETTDAGSSWAMRPDDPRRMPNFSHGTAGVSFFLARLYQATDEQRFLEAALSGGHQLLALADRGLVYHHAPGGEELFYLGWCHGPAGTAQLYQLLAEITGDPIWDDAVRRGASAVVAQGVPEHRTEGFWNNAGQCCGSAGLGEYFLRLLRTADEPASYRDLCERICTDLDQRATVVDGGLSWVQAEHRARPDLLQAQVGYMQGAAGIGLWLLHWDGYLHGRAPYSVLPDGL